jgi:hypothetical protein
MTSGSFGWAVVGGDPGNVEVTVGLSRVGVVGVGSVEEVAEVGRVEVPDTAGARVVGVPTPEEGCDTVDDGRDGVTVVGEAAVVVDVWVLVGEAVVVGPPST